MGSKDDVYRLEDIVKETQAMVPQKNNKRKAETYRSPKNVKAVKLAQAKQASQPLMVTAESTKMN